MTTALNVLASHRLHVHLLDDVAEVSGGIPQGLSSLGLTDAIEGSDHQTVAIGGPGRPHRRPLPEGIAAEVGAELSAPPGGASVGGDLHLADPVSPVEGDALQRDGLPYRHSCSGRWDNDERPHRHSRDGYR